MTSLSASKKDVRARVRAAREARAPQERTAAAQRIARSATALLPTDPSLIGAYQSMAAEPGTRDLITVIVERGHRLVVPRITGSGLVWVEIDATTEYARGPLGIAEPTGPSLPSYPSPLSDAAVLFMPGLSVDRRGHRLGQGGGYYDRALVDVAPHAQGGPLRVTLLFDDEFVEEVPAEAHDCTIDVIVTPERTITIGS